MHLYNLEIDIQNDAFLNTEIYNDYVKGALYKYLSLPVQL